MIPDNILLLVEGLSRRSQHVSMATYDLLISSLDNFPRQTTAQMPLDDLYFLLNLQDLLIDFKHLAHD